MSSPPTVETFKGISWEECEDFIRAIRAAAWKEGKFRDPSWIADFAALHLARKALSWHSRLPKDVRQDWDKLEVALLDRWAPPEEDDTPRIEPTPAAAPSLNHKDRANRPLQGVLQLVIDGSDEIFYFERGMNGYGVVTDEAKEAPRFRCSSLSNRTILEQIDGPRHSWLAVQWREADPDLKNGPTDYGLLVLVDSLTLKTSWAPNTPYQLASCTLSTDGEVIPFWEKSDTSKINIGMFRNSRGSICVAADPNAYSMKYSSDKRVKIFIGPTD